MVKISLHFILFTPVGKRSRRSNQSIATNKSEENQICSEAWCEVTVLNSPVLTSSLPVGWFCVQVNRLRLRGKTFCQQCDLGKTPDFGYITAVVWMWNFPKGPCGKAWYLSRGAVGSWWNFKEWSLVSRNQVAGSMPLKEMLNAALSSPSLHLSDAEAWVSVIFHSDMLFLSRPQSDRPNDYWHFQKLWSKTHLFSLLTDFSQIYVTVT